MEIATLAQYGSSGVALALAGVIYYAFQQNTELSKNHQKLLSNHLEHMTAAYDKNAKAMEELREVIGSCRYNHR